MATITIKNVGTIKNIENQKLKRNLLTSLKKLNAFWSYDISSVTVKTVSDETLIEKSLIHLEIEDINKLFTIFPYKKIREVWKTRLCRQEPYYHGTNSMLAYMYFNIKNPDRYLKTIATKNIKTIKKNADEWFNATYGDSF